MQAALDDLTDAVNTAETALAHALHTSGYRPA
jgi:hypothetical protein